MRFGVWIPAVVLFLLCIFLSAANRSTQECASFSEAGKFVGSNTCVRGTVALVEYRESGFTLLQFCKEAKQCPFRVVVFPAEASKIGDLRQLEGRQIEITGQVKDYHGHVEIVLRRSKQLLGESAFLVVPMVPTEYDVERKGHYSSGKFSHAKSKKSDRKQGKPVDIEDPEEPE